MSETITPTPPAHAAVPAPATAADAVWAAAEADAPVPAAGPADVLCGSARVAAGMLMAWAVIAVVIGLACPGAARGWLGFPFTGVPNQLGQAWSILLANLRLAAGVGVAAAVAQLRLLGRPRRAVTAAARLCDTGVALAVLANLAIVGAATGAYGFRMVHAMLPHGPLELAAFALVLSLHLHARRSRLAARTWIAVAAITTVLLVIAALLETYVATV
ncbi:hypothetical protein [Conexibacter woesei]|uniref:hypothetical protein n=1 Tax=Conexibacter woesei TaxID=191495 RepID=UPI000405296A|nr:hypothetical protein [Conexibacter woesei]